MQKIILYLIIGCLSPILLYSCGETQSIYVITPAEVNFKINTNSTDKELTTPSNIKTFTSPRLANESIGRSGLLVICSAHTITGSIYGLYAYDLCCPYENAQNIRVSPNQKDGTAKCSTCGTVYDVFNGLGSVVSGPSKNGLQRYNVRYASSEPGIFYITR